MIGAQYGPTRAHVGPALAHEEGETISEICSFCNWHRKESLSFMIFHVFCQSAFPCVVLKPDHLVHTSFNKKKNWFTCYVMWWKMFCDPTASNLDLIGVWSRWNNFCSWGSRDEEGGEFFTLSFTDPFDDLDGVWCVFILIEGLVLEIKSFSYYYYSLKSST